jgi:hypothetical protein
MPNWADVTNCGLVQVDELPEPPGGIVAAGLDGAGDGDRVGDGAELAEGAGSLAVAVAVVPECLAVGVLAAGDGLRFGFGIFATVGVAAGRGRAVADPLAVPFPATTVERASAALTPRQPQRPPPASRTQPTATATIPPRLRGSTGNRQRRRGAGPPASPASRLSPPSTWLTNPPLLSVVAESYGFCPFA